MIRRRKTRLVKAGTVRIGGRRPIVIQSMTKVPTTNVDACIGQIEQLTAGGCGLIRVAVPSQQDVAAFAQVVQGVHVPLVADVHFSKDCAIGAIEAGAAKIRLNPGNLKSQDDLLDIIDAAKRHHVAVRIGINEASIRNLKGGDTPPQKRMSLMMREMRSYVRLFEKQDFADLVLSIKSANTRRTIEVNRLLSRTFDYPIHLGLTHAGLPEDAIIPSAVTIGSLISQGIGDTLRVSVAGDPVQEVRIGQDILRSVGLYPREEPELIVCPTCGRCQIDVVGLARRVKDSLGGRRQRARIAVMGCIVNGPGEAADADIAVCAAKGKGFLYRKGEKICTVPEAQLVSALLDELERLRSP